MDEVLRLRAEGLPQTTVAERLGLDRSFVSRLETIGELRKGARGALLAFPVANAEDVRALAARHGLEFVLVWNNAERERFLAERSGRELVHELLALVARLRTFDRVVLVASEQWLDLGRVLIGPGLVPVSLGPSPVGQDREVDLAELDIVLTSVID